MWQPISILELNYEVSKTEILLSANQMIFWESIKIDPEKWHEHHYANEGNGFWVVAICGKRVIWFNDIEYGFNISKYSKYGEIDEYYCNQDELNIVVIRLHELAKLSKDITE